MPIDANTILQLIVAVVVCSLIGIPSYRIRVVSFSGLLSGYVMGVGIIMTGGWGAFVIIMMFFVLSGLTTKFHYDKKKKKGIAESDGGARGYKNVFGNGLVALFFSLLYFSYGGAVFLAGYMGAAASATCDTAGGEIGRLSKTDPFMITTFKRVPAGTDGAISLLGKSAEIAICIILGLIGWIVGIPTGALNGVNLLMITLAGGFIGASMDSYLGATLETSVDWFSNNYTNFFCTICGSLASIAIYYVLI